MPVDETPSATLMASVLHELDELHASPPQDEYADLPPAYGSFEHAYASWHAADEASQAIAEIDGDPAVAAAEDMLKEAKESLEGMKKNSEDAFKALHPKQNSFASFFHFGKSMRKSSHVHVNAKDSMTIPSTADGQPTGEFKGAYEAQLKQELIVQGLLERVAEFSRKKEELGKVASSGTLAWVQLKRIADKTLISTDMGEAMEKLQSAENAYDVAKKTTTDLTRARLAVRSSHSYFTSALKISDGVHGTATGRTILGGLGGGVNEMDKALVYQKSVIMASKAQICLNEVVRILGPRVHMIPEERRDDYEALKVKGLMQMSKIYNLLFGGPALPSGVAGSVKLMFERQEAAFAHLTRLAVWIQDIVPICITEEKLVLNLRDDARRDVAALLHANIHRGGDHLSLIIPQLPTN